VLRRILGLLSAVCFVPACSAGEGESTGVARVRDPSASGATDGDFVTPGVNPTPGSTQTPDGSRSTGELFRVT
jgi:hypothetical protein